MQGHLTHMLKYALTSHVELALPTPPVPLSEVKNCPFIGGTTKPKAWPLGDGNAKIDGKFIVEKLLPFLPDTSLYQVATSLSWKMCAAVAAAGYRMDDDDRWLKPIRFRKNAGGGDEWTMHVAKVYPTFEMCVKYSAAVQYLSRVNKLKVLKTASSFTIYRKPTCSEQGCNKITRSFHNMFMRFVCTKCVNQKKLTFSLMSRSVAKRCFAVNRFQLKTIPCARFRNENSQYGPAPLWYMRQHVMKLSARVWRQKIQKRRDPMFQSHGAASVVVAQTGYTESWKQSRATRVLQLNPANRINPDPPINSSVCYDMALEVPRDKRRLFKPHFEKIPRALRVLQDVDMKKAKIGRPVSNNTAKIWLREFTVQ